MASFWTVCVRFLLHYQAQERPAFKHILKSTPILKSKENHHVWIWGYAWIQVLQIGHMSQQQSWTPIQTQTQQKKQKDHVIKYWIQLILHELYRFYTILPVYTPLCVKYGHVIMKTAISSVGIINS